MPIIARGRIIVTLLSVVWICTVCWFEYFVFVKKGEACSWPDSKFAPPTNNDKPHHLLVIADPQILDRHSYVDRNAFMSWLTQLIVDTNLRKNWWVGLSKKPDSVVFVGDLMDRGREDMPDAEYNAYVRRFKRIFNSKPSIPTYYATGNHDVGLGHGETFSPKRYDRYKANFGPLNYQIQLANHTLVFIDAPGYVDEESELNTHPIPENPKHRVGGTYEFIENFKKGKDPVILFSHIPLYRPDGNGCGFLRERGAIRPGNGLGYQNLLSKQATLKLLETFQPDLILSGDDHDYCRYEHFVSSTPERPNAPNAKEISIKSLSIAMGIKRPGFQLVSLAPPDLRKPAFQHKSLNDSPCFLPDQLGIYLRIYIPLTVITIGILLMSNLCCWTSRRTSMRLTRGRRSSNLDIPLPLPVSAGVEKFETPITLRTRPWLSPFVFCAVPRTQRRNALVNFLLDFRDTALYPISVFVLTFWWFM
ncbi:Metallo-dependent phosphatase [Coprinopsis marcescibilis]|uniref:Metallo-dependent phosphatase n=1 Tax=Coprinopsis marcescibilis TaxID=230819 RepID=A0A5C3KUM1_COPMA|nr:Metallo-dependent phosphatase [Coprinopsis marcescibilis]